jgi:outer membrane protein assembly factor BamB
MPTTYSRLSSLITVSLLALATIASAADWPQFRGPNRDGLSAETGLAREWPKDGPPQLWKISNLGEGYGSLAVVGDRIYVQGTNGQESLVFALSRADGKTLWTTALGPRLVLDQGNGPRGTPTVEGDALYVLTENGDLARLSTTDGKIAWKVNILEEFKAKNIGWGISESPLIDGNNVIVTPGGEATFAALDKNTGKTVWKSARLAERAGYASAIAADVGPVRVITNFTHDAGVGVRASDGKRLWEYRAPANGTANCTTPIFHNNRVFYSSAYGTGAGLLQLGPRGAEVDSREVYFTKEMKNHHGGVVLIDGHIYGFDDHILTCLEFDTGAVKWQDRSVGKGAVIAADGMLYLLGERHTMGLAVATPEGYSERGRFTIENRDQPSWAHPVVSNGVLYIRNKDVLSANRIGLQSGSAGGD